MSIFRITLRYKGKTAAVKRWLYQSEKSWRRALEKRKRIRGSMFDEPGILNLISEKLVDDAWVLVESWWNC